MKNVYNIFYEVKNSVLRNIRRLPIQESSISNSCFGISKIEVKRCSEADSLHSKKWRQFCHTMHRDNIICCSRDTNNLRDENIAGLMYHEIAHIISEKYQELLFEDSGLCVKEYKEYDDSILFIMDGMEVDAEIFADAVSERILFSRIYYDENKIQWFPIYLLGR